MAATYYVPKIIASMMMMTAVVTSWSLARLHVRMPARPCHGTGLCLACWCN
jgi:hypothetical protein